MRKGAICFFLFSFSFCKAQDTLFLMNGKKMVVKVAYVDYRVIYSIPPGDRQKYIWLSQVRRIKYGDGTTFTNNNPSDTTRVKFANPYIVFSGGANIPFGDYIGTTYAVQDETTGDYSYNNAGYANNGTVFSVAGG